MAKIEILLKIEAEANEEYEIRDFINRLVAPYLTVTDIESETIYGQET